MAGLPCMSRGVALRLAQELSRSAASEVANAKVGRGRDKEERG